MMPFVYFFLYIKSVKGDIELKHQGHKEAIIYNLFIYYQLTKITKNWNLHHSLKPIISTNIWVDRKVFEKYRKIQNFSRVL